MGLKLKKRLIPKALQDKASIVFILLMVPLVYWFEVFIGLPELHEPGTFWHNVHFIGGTCVLFTLVSNFLAAIFMDSSVPRTDIPANGNNYCYICNVTTPQRSHHCSMCDVCVLRRDHHCMFTGNCVGLYSHRFFLSFLLHLFIGGCYGTWVNLQVVWPKLTLHGLINGLRLLMPAITLLIDSGKPAEEQLGILVSGLAIAAMVIALGFLVYHGRNALTGQTAFETSKDNRMYDTGSYIENLKQVMGTRWYIAWIHPLIPSPVFDDASLWEQKER